VAGSRIQLQLRSLVRRTGTLELSLAEVPIPRPGPGEVLVRVEAAPLNPSDHGLLFAAADMSKAVQSGSRDRPMIIAPVPPEAMKSLGGRWDQSLPIGYEGAGVVVDTDASDAARALQGKKVAIFGGAMYSQFRSIGADQCLLLPDEISVEEGASAFVNPMTALGMIDTMRREGHSAIVHTAAASNLGQMLCRLCCAEKVGLVNIVRSNDQVRLLRSLGAAHVCNSRSDHFIEELTEAIAATHATIGFDAIGGGPLTGQILKAMEIVASKSNRTYSRYGSAVHKQVYVYGGLNLRPTELRRDYGMSWGVGGWLVMNFMERVGPSVVAELKQRIVDNLRTTFLTRYSHEIGLADVLRLEMIAAYGKRETGEKYLVNPNPIARPPSSST
jgi:NADPH:quinone reductase